MIYDEARRFEATRCPEAVASKPILPVVPSKNKKDDDMIRVRCGRSLEFCHSTRAILVIEVFNWWWW